jgi:hypothetical protein
VLEGHLRQAAAAHGWTTTMADDWVWIVNHEDATWDPLAKNPTSTAFGIGQFLDTTWASVGLTKQLDPLAQIDAMGTYIAQRYTDPTRAKAFWQANHYY